jgi:XTP/dITP diphosphohydrolase
MPKLVVATTNRGKLREIAELLAGVPLDLVALAEWPDLAAPEENGQTFAQNARLKALYYAAHTGELTVADDSGLEIDQLGGAPGVESARFGGPGSTYPEKFELLYKMLRDRGVPSPDCPDGGPARFVCALALARGDRILFETPGIVQGRIALEPRGRGGFGYDPIFFYPPLGCTLAEAGAAQKNGVSHRGDAFRALRAWLLEDGLSAEGLAR